MHELSKSLTTLYGKGYSISNLEYIRNFFLVYQKRIPQSLTGEFKTVFNLSWTHYVLLLKIKTEEERNFYEIEAAQNNWSVRELQRQFSAALFERLALSKDKNGVRKLALEGQTIEKPSDVIKSHYVLEFLGLKDWKTQSPGYRSNANVRELL